MDARGLKEKYQTVLALFVYSGILIPLLAVISIMDLPFTKSWWFIVPVGVAYGIGALWIAFRFKINIVFKILWLLIVLWYFL